MKHLYLLCIVLTTIWLPACTFTYTDESVEGNGIEGSQSSDFSSFENLEISGSFDIKLTPSPDHRVVVQADENLLPYIIVKQSGNTLSIKMKNNIRFSSRKMVKIEVYLEQLRGVELAGSSKLKTTDRFTHPQSMHFTIAGSGDIEAEVKSPEVITSIGGSGKAKLSGETRIAEGNIGGSGDYLAKNLMCEDVKISIAGSGNAEVFASRALDVSIAGSGSVYYGGAPKVQQSIAGSGKVKAF